MATRGPSRPRGDIGLGDLAHAICDLDLDNKHHLHLAARCLGFEGVAHPDNSRPQTAVDARMRRHTAQKSKQTRRRRAFAPPESDITPEPEGGVLTSTLVPRPPAVAQSPPDWLQHAEPEPPKQPRITRQPLLLKNRTAGLLKAAMAVRRPGRLLDMPRLIDQVVAGRPLLELPRLPVGSLEHGVDLLCDYGESMQPFYADLQDLGESLVRLLGSTNCRLFEYETDPGRAIAWSAADNPLPWRPKASRPLLLATDFGRGNPRGLRQRLRPAIWRAFLHRTRQAGVPVLACSPLPPATWPRWLGHDVKVIHWDPRTRASSVSRLIGSGHEIGR